MIERGGRVKDITVAGDGETYEDTAPHCDADSSGRSPGDAITGIIAGQAIARSRQLKPVRNDKLSARRGGAGRSTVDCRSALEDDCGGGSDNHGCVFGARGQSFANAHSSLGRRIAVVLSHNARNDCSIAVEWLINVVERVGRTSNVSARAAFDESACKK